LDIGYLAIPRWCNRAAVQFPGESYPQNVSAGTPRERAREDGHDVRGGIDPGSVLRFEFTLYDALVSIGVPAAKARAVIDALEHDMGSTLATKQDLDHLKELFTRDIERLNERVGRDMELLRSSMTVRLGSIQVVAAGLLFAALKLT
jgi:hypothetical protein